MRSDIEKLQRIANRETRLIIGLMSGTSLDGLDVALCSISGSGPQSRVKLRAFITKSYPETFRMRIRAIFSRHDADLEKVTIMNAVTGTYHGQLVLECLEEWGIKPQEIDLVASHGQTIYHAPAAFHGQNDLPDATLQIGDGDHVAVKTGIITMSDFRQKHIAAGGEGAPLAVYGDYLIFSEAGENRMMLNIGGIANFTFLPGDLDASRVFSSDVGTGNTLMDAQMQQHFGKAFDKDAAIARSGKVNEALLESLFHHPFFAMDFPKTTGPELFNATYLHRAQSESNTLHIPQADVMATLNRFSAEGIIRAMKSCFQGEKFSVYASGGGMHNPMLMDHIRRSLPGVPIRNTQDLGIDPDAKEAVLFAVLANENIAGNRVDFGKRGKIPAVTMGKISFPA